MVAAVLLNCVYDTFIRACMSACASMHACVCVCVCVCVSVYLYVHVHNYVNDIMHNKCVCVCVCVCVYVSMCV